MSLKLFGGFYKDKLALLLAQGETEDNPQGASKLNILKEFKKILERSTCYPPGLPQGASKLNILEDFLKIYLVTS